MSKKIDQIDKYHKTKKGRITFGAIELVAAYIFVSLAIDSGSLLQYLVAILLFIGGVNNLVKVVIHKSKANGKKTKR